ncbi:hypothetical protein GEV27_09405 [Aeromicrobium sp. S22]|uniref:hypothetical protein n=1 Tax=Aeromicrobium sp. S22 TaxID=2662029 RepID=UPI00129D62C7|nr:hypothetical protein [Aeromicrobium sp. S22]MRK01737.1 hypothetical protein [Aeromicrobium sp. S22]
MGRRVLQVVALAVAVVLAVGAGRLVRHHLEGPDPVDAVRAATMAYATGDCAALRRVTVDPREIRCEDVVSVRDAYRDEGLRPATFTYAVVSRVDEDATVRISYRRGKDALQELVRVRRVDDAWKVFPATMAVG